MADNIVRLALYESKAIVPVQTFAPGTYQIPMQVEGNSLLSTVYVKAVDAGASVKANYWDFGPGNGNLTGERVDLQSHQSIAVGGVTDRLIVTGMHNKPRLELVVTGGSVEVGVYLSVVATFASDLDQNLKLDAQLANLVHDKGLPPVTYDAENGRFYFLRSYRGVLLSQADEGVPFFAEDTIAGVPASQETALTFTVPTGIIRKLTQVVVSSTIRGLFKVYADSDIIGSGRLGPANLNVSFQFSPPRPIAAEAVVTVTFEAPADAPVASVDCYVQASDFAL